MKKFIVLTLSLVLCFMTTACKQGEGNAREAVDVYIQNLQNGSYEAAYDSISDFDKTNITLEEFTEWRNAVAKIQSIGDYSIDKKVDTFKNYEYKGAKFKKAYGYLVKQQLNKHLDIDPGSYDTEQYHIMVVQQDKDWKVALLIIDLKSHTDKINRKIEEKNAAGK
ncbi:MAG: hypothetical protein PHC69_03055 [Ruminiclostridium sp.]|nr:hypothetical protein [Ruminiclostridium sp.]